jgi:hypothetical protein
MGRGDSGPDPAPAVEVAEQTRIYPLWLEEKDISPMEFPNGSGRRVDMMYPTDSSYFDKLKAFVDDEPVTAITPELRGVLASIGIIKDRPFEPSPRQRELLEKAAAVAPKMILATRMVPRADERDLYYNDRRYRRVWAGATAEYMQESYLDIDQRAQFFQYAYSSAPAMVMRTIDAGSKYPCTGEDADGDTLDGGNHYRLHLPPNPPAALFWAVTAYNFTDGTMPETEQLLPSVNMYDQPDQNEDGSVDLYFGPTRPAEAGDRNWIQTIEGRALLVVIRLYGTETEFFDQSWKPDDVVKQTT